MKHEGQQVDNKRISGEEEGVDRTMTVAQSFRKMRLNDWGNSLKAWPTEAKARYPRYMRYDRSRAITVAVCGI
uniref:Uncharacterized protein n=1 Tax=Heterorhabditis bacteriophora TaxID=37862 RepID=A0A1I7WN69_HETBA